MPGEHFDFRALRRFIKGAVTAPLLERLGDPIEFDFAIGAKTAKAALTSMEMLTWENVVYRANDHAGAQQYVELGDDWHNHAYDLEWDIFTNEIQPLRELFDSAWLEHGLPLKKRGDSGQTTVSFAFMALEAVAGDICYASVVKRSFARAYFEPVFMSGHLPCGWKGTLPSAVPDKRDVGPIITEKYAAKSLKELFGDGKLIVY